MFKTLTEGFSPCGPDLRGVFFMRETYRLAALARAAAIGVSVLGATALAGCQTLGLEDDELTLANMPANLAVDPFAWQGALDTLKFLPIASADPATGRIETDWGSLTNNTSEQVRASVQIYPGTLNASSVAVTVYRQVNGQPASVDPSTGPRVQEAILLRARQLKTAIQQDE